MSASVGCTTVIADLTRIGWGGVVVLVGFVLKNGVGGVVLVGVEGVKSDILSPVLVKPSAGCHSCHFSLSCAIVLSKPYASCRSCPFSLSCAARPFIVTVSIGVMVIIVVIIVMIMVNILSDMIMVHVVKRVVRGVVVSVVQHDAMSTSSIVSIDFIVSMSFSVGAGVTHRVVHLELHVVIG